ncbi:hypothetical protein CDAR_598271 [Caerostris darwini]|uniref:Uncharacterized protein n=1 Tax=Caerostris darwini TaxID=1538125 RepID=A0AAV4QJK4_9ARAC|nr:hypothetical protein CDAR_598271 [Caerostris darwini]
MVNITNTFKKRAIPVSLCAQDVARNSVFHLVEMKKDAQIARGSYFSGKAKFHGVQFTAQNAPFLEKHASHGPLCARPTACEVTGEEGSFIRKKPCSYETLLRSLSSRQSEDLQLLVVSLR